MKAIFEVYDVNICTLTKASSALYLSECIAPLRSSVMKGKKMQPCDINFWGPIKSVYGPPA
jgi:hypothetical protein